ncbi:hypothetical protein KY331_00860 [Candidatus Woesearchaeota archaeon]|nr:hypothetical protein [Candidatus Woesearchaeota archaeon]
MDEEKGIGQLLDYIQSDSKETLKLEFDYDISHMHVARSLSFNHDRNPVHQESLEAKLLLLSIVSQGILAATLKSIPGISSERVFDVCAEKIRALPGVVIAPGIWLTGLADRYLTFPDEKPKNMPDFHEPNLRPFSTITYASSTYFGPVVVPIEGSTLVKLSFTAKKKKKKGISATEINFQIKAEDFLGNERRAQRTKMDVFPGNTDPGLIVKFYADGIKGLTDIRTRYREGEPAQINGEESIFTKSHSTYVPPDDYSNYGVSIGREGIGDVYNAISSLALQTKIPRVLFMALTGFGKAGKYIAASNGYYMPPTKQEGETEEERVAREELALERFKKEQERLDALVDYKEISNCSNTLLDLLIKQKRMYISQKTFFVPGQEVKPTDNFTLNVSLESYNPETGQHRFISEANTEKGLLSWREGKRIMIGETMISATPLMTMELIKYLRHFGVGMKLQSF